MAKRKIAVLYGSVRHHRQGIRAARFIEKLAAARGWEVDFIDAKAENLPLLDEMYKEMENPPEGLQRLHQRLEAAEGYLVVTGEYNHSFPPALKNLLDHFQQEYLFKPAGIVSYSAGIFGGVRSAVQLRITLGELGMVTISSMLPILSVHKSIDEEGNAQDEKYEKFAARFLDEFAWYVEALSRQRAEGTPF